MNHNAKPLNTGLISIIIPAYNASNTIEKCLKSILSQTYNNFEVIIIDDGSSDNILTKLNKYINIDKRIHYYWFENGGVSKARNRGIKISKGEYIQFIDADDDISKNYLKIMLDLIIKNSSELAICNFNHPIFKTQSEEKCFNLTQKEDFFQIYQDTFAFVVPWNKLWKRSAITVLFDESIKIAEDEIFNLANLKNINKISFTDKRLYNYYVSPDSCINSLVKDNLFWKKQNSIYYTIANLTKKRLKIINDLIEKKHHPINNVTDLLYIRVVDFIFWQIPVLISAGATKYTLTQEYKNIFNNKYFITAYNSKKKYGYKLLSKNINMIEKFITCCFEIYYDKESPIDVNKVDIYRELFNSIFLEKFDDLNLIDKDAKILYKISNGSIIKSRYLKNT